MAVRIDNYDVNNNEMQLHRDNVHRLTADYNRLQAMYDELQRNQAIKVSSSEDENLED